MNPFKPIAHAWRDYQQARRVERLEAALPDALLYAASLPPRTPLEKVIEDLADDSTELAALFSRADASVKAGESVPRALENAGDASGSPVVRRATRLLAQGHRTGADLTGAIKRVADDVITLQSLRDEAAAAATLHQYTILGGGALVVPAVLGVLLTLAGSLPDSFDGLGSGADPAVRAALSSVTPWAVQGYLVLFGGLAGAFVALAQGRPKRAIVYAAAVAPVAWTVFWLARWFAPGLGR